MAEEFSSLLTPECNQVLKIAKENTLKAEVGVETERLREESIKEEMFDKEIKKIRTETERIKARIRIFSELTHDQKFEYLKLKRKLEGKDNKNIDVLLNYI